MIRRFRVNGYKSLRNVEIELAPLTVIFGPNAAGKSNLLDSLSLLARMATEANLDTAFTEHRGTPIEAFSLPPGGIPELLSSGENATFSFEVDVDLSDAVVEAVESEVRRVREGLSHDPPIKRRSVTEKSLRYTLEVQIVPATGVLRIADERLEALNRFGEPKASRKPFLETMPRHNRIHLRMEKQSHPTYEDLWQDRTVVSKPLYAPHYPHITAFRMELERWKFYFLEPSVMRREAALKEVDRLSHDGSDLAAFYHTLQTRSARMFDTYVKALRQVVPSVESVNVDTTKQGFLQMTVTDGGTPFSSRLISEGTLRVLGLLAITNPLKPVSLVGYEEPENGVHPQRLSLIAKLLATAAERGTTQFLINTHSTVLPDEFADVDGAFLINCTRTSDTSQFRRLEPKRTLLRISELASGLEEDVPSSTIGERMVRGDFG